MPIQYLSTTPNPPMIHAPAPARTQTYAPRPRVYTQVIQRQHPWSQVQTLGNYAPTTIRDSGNTWNFAPRIALDLSRVSSRASSRVSNRSSQSSVVNEIVRQAMPTMATVMGVNND